MTISALAGTSTSLVMHFTTSMGAPASPPATSSSLTLKRNARRRSIRYTGRRADHQRGLQRNAALLALAPMVAAVIARAEKHAGSRRAFDMAAVVADVDDAGLRIFCEPVRRRGERRAVVTGRGNGNREFAQTAFLHQRRTRVDDFVHRRFFDDLRRNRIALRFVPAIDDLFRFTLKPKP